MKRTLTIGRTTWTLTVLTLSKERSPASEFEREVAWLRERIDSAPDFPCRVVATKDLVTYVERGIQHGDVNARSWRRRSYFRRLAAYVAQQFEFTDKASQQQAATRLFTNWQGGVA